MTICHKGKRTLKVSVNAWPAHRAHGDVEGTCAELKKKGHKSELANAKGAEHSEQAEQHGKSGDSHGKSDDSHGKSQESHGKSHDK